MWLHARNLQNKIESSILQENNVINEWNITHVLRIITWKDSSSNENFPGHERCLFSQINISLCYDPSAYRPSGISCKIKFSGLDNQWASVSLWWQLNHSIVSENQKILNTPGRFERQNSISFTSWWLNTQWLFHWLLHEKLGAQIWWLKLKSCKVNIMPVGNSDRVMKKTRYGTIFCLHIINALVIKG